MAFSSSSFFKDLNTQKVEKNAHSNRTVQNETHKRVEKNAHFNEKIQNTHTKSNASSNQTVPKQNKKTHKKVEKNAYFNEKIQNTTRKRLK